MKHTKGKWEKHTPIDGDYYLVDDNAGKLFAKTWTEANASLIAAAPELLEACKYTLDAISKSEITAPKWLQVHIGESVKMLKAAIAKAEGKLP